MAGHRSFEELRSKLTPSARARADERSATLESELLLAEINARAAIVENELDSVSMLSAEEMAVSDLRQLVRSFGAELHLSIALPDGRRVRVG